MEEEESETPEIDGRQDFSLFGRWLEISQTHEMASRCSQQATLNARVQWGITDAKMKGEKNVSAEKNKGIISIR